MYYYITPPWDDFSMLDISAVGIMPVPVPATAGIGNNSPRARSWVSSNRLLENHPREWCDLHRLTYTVGIYITNNSGKQYSNNDGIPTIIRKKNPVV